MTQPGEEIPIPLVGYSPDMIGEPITIRQPALGGGVIERHETLAGVCPFTGFVRVHTRGGVLYFPQDECFLRY